MLKSLYLNNRFFYLFGGLIPVFFLGFVFPALFPVAQLLLLAAVALTGLDIMLLYRSRASLRCKRRLPKVFSLGDASRVYVDLQNLSAQKLRLEVIDELPFQFQVRDFSIRLSLEPGEVKTVHYELRPVVRGEHAFGELRAFAETRLGMVQRRYTFPLQAVVPVYPSVIQMKRFELSTFNQVASQHGVKKLRRLGHSYEFEQIKSYVRGDDYRSINWKATGRRASLMVNQYQEERAQQIYNVIDKSRVMKLPFEGLSLLDHAINTSLVVSNIALRKKDKAGLLTFSNKMGAILKADWKSNQLNKILSALYKEREGNLDSNYELLYYAVRKFIKVRSLMILYTNFESSYALERVLPVLRKLNRRHLLVVVFFKNTEVEEFVERPGGNVEEVYQQTTARQYMAEKEQMAQRLRQHGIQAVLTPPEELSVNAINKYLELKSRGFI